MGGDGRGGLTWEVTVKGPNFMRRAGEGGILGCLGGCSRVCRCCKVRCQVCARERVFLEVDCEVPRQFVDRRHSRLGLRA